MTKKTDCIYFGFLINSESQEEFCYMKFSVNCENCTEFVRKQIPEEFVVLDTELRNNPFGKMCISKELLNKIGGNNGKTDN